MSSCVARRIDRGERRLRGLEARFLDGGRVVEGAVEVADLLLVAARRRACAGNASMMALHPLLGFRIELARTCPTRCGPAGIGLLSSHWPMA